MKYDEALLIEQPVEQIIPRRKSIVRRGYREYSVGFGAAFVHPNIESTLKTHSA
jgi:hypothetical protein